MTTTISESTAAAIAQLVEYTIQREYGADADNAIGGARAVALAELKHDLADQYYAANNSPDGLDSYAEAELRILVRDGLAARECQCRQRYGGACPHGQSTAGPCRAHYEADVPELGGMLLCGGCHVAEYEAQQ